ncbi:hypothetical protein ANCCEY_00788 [Ancylostoma ceylanicum]|uniref:Pre-mRNA-splicing factor Syf1/CRNKL1-like C-terminal HAT-repeats domain-containing protein n=1 Tax=Ancylostoma ceylanicum TaxID=53326 RepID=A0A0D6M7K0_9BILA|nr:hypothetical protein ANCCEY_00788 [Ancylostoma ceylanicum]
MFLEKHDYLGYEFKVYERGVAVFKWPQMFDIWNLYLANLNGMAEETGLNEDYVYRRVIGVNFNK